MSDTKSDAMPTKFDRLMGLLTGLPDSMMTKPSTVRVVPTLGVGGTEVWIIQTHRQQHRDQDGRVVSSEDTIFIEKLGNEGSVREVLPSSVADTIARQRDALTDRSRSAAGKRTAAARKARGDSFGFGRKKARKA